MQGNDYTPADAPSAMSVLAVGTATIAALYLGSDVFVPLALAILASFALAPIANRLRKIGLGRAPSAVLVVALALGLVGGFVWLLVHEAIVLAGQLPRYEYNLREKIRLFGGDTAGGTVIGQTAELLRRMQDELDRVTQNDKDGAGQDQDQGQPGAGQVAPDQAEQQVRPIPVEVHEPPASPLATLLDLGRAMAEPLATVGIILLFIVFVLVQREDLRDRFIRLFGIGDVHRTTKAMNDAAIRIGRYLLRQLGVNILYGALFGAALWVIGVPNAPLWGLMGTVLRFVPFIGAPISLLFPLALSLAVDSGWTMPLLTIGAFLVIETALAYVIEPYLFGAGTGLSTLALIVATLFWTLLWGPVGLLLAAPLTACLVVLGHHVPHLRFLEILLGNVQALSPDLKVYQRLLADDVDEATEVVEESVDEKGLLRTADEVLLPVLELAGRDRARGSLESGRAYMIADRIIATARELGPTPEGGEDGDTTSAASPAAGAARPVGIGRRIVCVGAGSRMDEAAAAVAAAVLPEAGLATVNPVGAAAARTMLARLMAEDGSTLLVVALGPRAAGRGRRLLRRLRLGQDTAATATATATASRLSTILLVHDGDDESAAAATALPTGEEAGADRVVTNLGEVVALFEAAAAPPLAPSAAAGAPTPADAQPHEPAAAAG